VKHPDCTVTVPHSAHTWYAGGSQWLESCGGIVPPTLDQACERVAAFAAEWKSDERLEVGLPGCDCGCGRYEIELHRSDLVALLAAVGWDVTAEQARTEPVDEPLFEVTE